MSKNHIVTYLNVNIFQFSAFVHHNRLFMHSWESFMCRKDERESWCWVSKSFHTKMSEFKHSSRFPYLIIKILMIWRIFVIFVPTARSFIVCWQSVCMCRRLLIKNNLLWSLLTTLHRYSNLSPLTASVVYGIASLMNPISGVVLLNLVDWSFYIPFLDLQFKTWRMFLIVCTIPNLISALLLIFLIPESPKYTFSQGDEAKTLEILRDIFRRNTGRSILEYEVKSLIKDAEFNEANAKASTGFFKFMWTQTAPLFKHPHMKNTMTACYLQFSILITINGFWTFFPEIQNKTYLWMANHPANATSTVCGILESFNHKNQTVAAIKGLSHCTTHLQIDTFINITIISLLYIVGWTVCSFIIDLTGKLLIIVLIMLICGISSALMMFINIPSISVYLYVVLQTAGLNMTIINSSTVELFPTKLR